MANEELINRAAEGIAKGIGYSLQEWGRDGKNVDDWDYLLIMVNARIAVDKYLEDNNRAEHWNKFITATIESIPLKRRAELSMNRFWANSIHILNQKGRFNDNQASCKGHN